MELRLTWRKQHVFNLFMTQQLLILGYLSNSIFIFANFRKLNVKRFQLEFVTNYTRETFEFRALGIAGYSKVINNWK